MYKIWYSAQFKKDMKRIVKRGYDRSEIEPILVLLSSGHSLPEQYDDHPLSGNWKGYRECHIKPDWLLIYKIERDNLILVLTRTGTHSDLFEGSRRP